MNFSRRILVAVIVVVLFTTYSSIIGSVYPSGESTPAIAMAQSFNNLVLTAAAIFFAFSFADARHWPTIGEAAGASFFGWWGAVVICGMVIDWTAQYTSSPTLTFISLVLWFLSSGLAVLSLVRILYIGNPRRLNEYQGRSLAKLLVKKDATRFLRATREATTIGADLMVRDLTDQLELALQNSDPARYSVRIAAVFISEVTWECFGGSITGLTTARAMRRVLSPHTVISNRLEIVDGREGTEPFDEVAQQALEVFVPLLTRFVSQARYFADLGERQSFESIIITGEALLSDYATIFDPEPQVQDSELARRKLELTTPQILSVYRAFAIRPCIATPATIYSVYQHVTGERFAGDYWISDPIVADLVERSGPKRRAIGFQLAGIYSESLLSWTLQPLSHHVDSSETGDGKDLIAASAWLKIMLSQGIIESASSARSFWRETVLRYRTGPTVSGRNDISIYEVAVGAATLSLLRLRPWVNAHQFRETKAFYSSLERPLREKVDSVVLRVAGISMEMATYRVITRMQGVVLDG